MHQTGIRVDEYNNINDDVITKRKRRRRWRRRGDDLFFYLRVGMSSGHKSQCN